jgi:hypothetical protein
LESFTDLAASNPLTCQRSMRSPEKRNRISLVYTERLSDTMGDASVQHRRGTFPSHPPY